MLLTLESSLKVVFMIYAAFWIGALVILNVAVGLLLRRRERLMGESHHEAHAPDHGGGH